MITVSLAVQDKMLWAEVHTFLQEHPVQIDCEQPQAIDLSAFVVALDRSRPDIVLIDVSVLRDTLRDSIQKIRLAAPASMIVALNTTDLTGPVLECFRAGADEYLFPPLADGMKRALERCDIEHKKSDSKMPSGKVVSFLSVKGGCGATTLSCHVAAELSRLDQRVLLADLDLNTGMVAFLMKSKSLYSVADALNNVHRLDASYWKALVSNGIPNLEVISAPAVMAAWKQPKMDEIRQVLAFARKQYQWTVADAGSGLNPYTMTVMELADEACLVTTPEIPALHQTKQVLQKLLGLGYKQERLRLVLNRVPKRSEIKPDEIQGMLGIPFFSIFPECNMDLHEAYSQGRLLPPASDIAKTTAHLARKLAGIEAPKPKSKFPFFR